MFTQIVNQTAAVIELTQCLMLGVSAVMGVMFFRN